MPGSPRPFLLQVDDAALDDLQDRLARTRWPDEPPDGEPWDYGTDVRWLQDLVEYWRSGFDWRAQEARFNALPQFTVRIDDVDVHFLHMAGQGRLPLLLTHGWPGSVWEFHKLIPLLRDEFTIVAPSLPGYTLSFQPGQRRFSIPDIAAVFDTLMHDVLGYSRYAAQGGDWGAFVSAYLAWSRPEHVLGIHLNLLPLRREPLPAPAADEQPEVSAYRAELDHWLRDETGYSAIQGTKPQTLAFGLTDSPVGLAAWILEKFRTWSDCHGSPQTSFTRDDLLTNVMLYWISGCIGSSFWPYYARAHTGWPLPAERRVEVPTAYQGFPRDILHPPRALAEQAFNIQRWSLAPTGGHFAALEEPRLLADDIRAFFHARG